MNSQLCKLGVLHERVVILNPNAKETTHSVQSYTWTDWVVSFAFGFYVHCNNRMSITLEYMSSTGCNTVHLYLRL